MKTRWIVTGADGQLGREACRHIVGAGHVCLGLSRSQLDISDEAEVFRVVEAFKPDRILNAAAFTAVDLAETSPTRADEVNHVGARNLAQAATAHGTRLVHVSTDYVFDGLSETPYEEESPCNPISVYGRTKQDGEMAVRSTDERHLVVRTAWLYGEGGRNFVTTMMRAAAEEREVRVVDDQFGQPTYTGDLVRFIFDLDSATGRDGGTFHGTSSGSCSWYTLAREVYGSMGVATFKVSPISTENYPTVAVRPRYSVLSHEKSNALGVRPIGPWIDSVRAFVRRNLKEMEGTGR